MSWLQTLKYFAGEGSSGSANLTGVFTASQQDPKAMAMLLLATAATIFAGIYNAIRHFKSIRNTWNALMRCKFTMELARISAISGGLCFIMAFTTISCFIQRCYVAGAQALSVPRLAMLCYQY